MIEFGDIDKFFVIQHNPSSNGISSQISSQFGIEQERIKLIIPDKNSGLEVSDIRTITRLPIKPELRNSYNKIIQESIIYKYNHIAVLEDNLVFSYEIKNINDFLNHIPDDWEIISMGGCWHYAPEPLINEHVARHYYSLEEPALIINSSVFNLFLKDLDSIVEHKHTKNIKYYGPTNDLIWKLSKPGTTNIYSVLEPDQISDFTKKVYLRNPSHQYTWMSRNNTINDYINRVSSNHSDKGYSAKFPENSLPVRRQGCKFLKMPDDGYVLTNELGTTGIKLTPLIQALWECLDGSNTIHELEQLIDSSNSHADIQIKMMHENLHALWSNHLVSIENAHSNIKMSVAGLKRCGNHAIIHWLLSNLNFRHQVHIPAPHDSMTNRDGTVRFFNNIDQWMPIKSAVSLQSLEDKCISEISAITSRHCNKNVLILRDPLNMLASRIKGEGVNYKRHKHILNLWVEYAREYINETTFLDITPISYNEWLISRDYRDQICNSLGVENYDETEYVSTSGRGSSFIGVNKDATYNYLNRYKMITFQDSYIDLFKNDELIQLSNTIFPDIDITGYFNKTRLSAN